MTLLKIAAALGALYLVLVLLMALAQDRLLFPRWAIPAGTAPLPAGAERLSIEIEGVGPLVGVFFPARRQPPAGAALILGFGGNAWAADTLAATLHATFPDRHVVAFDYRGYGASAGRPSAETILADAVRIHDHVTDARDADRIVAVGLSLGAGPAAHLASLRSVAGLILVTPFDTLTALARDLYPWLPVRLLLRHRMDVAGALAQSSVRVAVIAAAEDEIVPSRRTEALRQAADAIVLDRVVAGAGHNDIYDRDEFIAAMREALSLIEGQSQSGG